MRNKPNIQPTLFHKFQAKQTREEGGAEPEWHQPDQQTFFPVDKSRREALALDDEIDKSTTRI